MSLVPTAAHILLFFFAQACQVSHKTFCVLWHACGIYGGKFTMSVKRIFV